MQWIEELFWFKITYWDQLLSLVNVLVPPPQEKQLRLRIKFSKGKERCYPCHKHDSSRWSSLSFSLVGEVFFLYLCSRFWARRWSDESDWLLTARAIASFCFVTKQSCFLQLEKGKRICLFHLGTNFFFVGTAKMGHAWSSFHSRRKERADYKRWVYFCSGLFSVRIKIHCFVSFWQKDAKQWILI